MLKAFNLFPRCCPGMSVTSKTVDFVDNESILCPGALPYQLAVPQVSSGASWLLGNGNKRAPRYGGSRKIRMSNVPVEPEAVNTGGLTRSWISQAQTSGGPGSSTPLLPIISFWRVFVLFLFLLCLFLSPTPMDFPDLQVFNLTHFHWPIRCPYIFSS